MNYHRQSIRLRDYNYASEGWYYLTVCTQNRELYFNNNNIKQIINNQWQELKNKFPNIDLDEYVIMPNHLHGIIVITNDKSCRGRPMCLPKQMCSSMQGEHTSQGGHIGPPLQKQQQKPALGQMVQWFKSITTNYYIYGIKTKNWPRFNKRLWQRNYYEHIIRDEQSLNKIRQYIKNNPLNWGEDRNNPKNYNIQ